MANHDKIIYARVPAALHDALEQERKRVSKMFGVDVNTSAVIRMILKQKLLPKRRVLRGEGDGR